MRLDLLASKRPDPLRRLAEELHQHGDHILVRMNVVVGLIGILLGSWIITQGLRGKLSKNSMTPK